ncbi:MAG: cell division protein ZapB [Elusimicrobia bacterium]|nr:cell division protein ZapB [Elusimicrobiota bacterium]
MELIEILTKKVHLAAEHLIRIKKEKGKLESDLKHLQDEHKRVQGVVRENEQLRERHAALSHRIEKLLKKMKHE